MLSSPFVSLKISNQIRYFYILRTTRLIKILVFKYSNFNIQSFLKLPGIRPGEKILDYWEPGRIMLSDPQAFLMSLMDFDKDSITEEMIEKLKKYVEDPLFTPMKIAKV